MSAFSPGGTPDLELGPLVKTVFDAGESLAVGAAGVARDTAYTAVGLGLLAYQRIQVRRREIERASRR